MRLWRRPWVRAFIAWTATLLAATVLLGLVAVEGIIRANEQCFFQVGPCPEFGGPEVALLQVALLGMPAIWLAGVLLGVLIRAATRRR